MFYTIEQIRQANRALGRHWFSRDTMRFFRTRVMCRVYPCGDGALFVTSDQHPARTGWVRRYSIRRVNAAGEISTVGRFGAWCTRSQALAEAGRLARQANAQANAQEVAG
jgi:hypothetical protein